MPGENSLGVRIHAGIDINIRRPFHIRKGKRIHAHAAGLGLLVSGGLAVFGIAALGLIFRFIQVPSSLAPLVRDYLVVIFLGLPAACLYNLCSALLRSAGHSAAVLAVLMVSILVNTGLDLYFVAGLHMGVFGAAAATVLAQCLSAALSYLYLRLRMPELMFRRRDCRFDPALARQILRVSSVTSMHQSGLYIGKLMVQGIVNGAGEAVIAGFTAATRLEGFANSFGDSGCAATSVFVAQAFGAEDEDGVKAYSRSSLKILTILGIVCSAVMYVTAPAACRLLTAAGTASWQSAVSYLRMISFFYLFCFLGNTFAGYFDGIGKVQIPFLGAASHIAIRIVLSAWLIGRMGLPAVAVASGIGWIWANLFWLAMRVLPGRLPKVRFWEAASALRHR